MGALAYPVAYRPGSAAYGNIGRGFQPPKAANDNFRFPTKAANDNFARAAADEALAAGERSFVRRTALAGLSRVAARAIPYVGLALLAYDLYELYRWWKGSAGTAAGWNFTGFHEISDCGWPEEMVTGVSGYYACGATITGPHGFTLPLPADDVTTFSTFYRHYTSIFGDAMRKAKGYERDTGYTGGVDTEYHEATDPSPQIWGLVGVPVGLGFLPAVDPMVLPIGQPVPTPEPIPFRVLPHRQPNPYRVEQSERGYSIGSIEDPSLGQSPTYEVSSKGAQEIKPEHSYSRPPKRTKERKVKGTRIGGKILSVVNPFTELLDAVDAIYKALPSEYKVPFRLPSGKRPRRKNGEWAVKYNPTPDEKALAIYRAWDKVDSATVVRAIKNLLTNEVEDRVLGTVSKKAQGINEILGRPVGVQAGPAL